MVLFYYLCKHTRQTAFICKAERPNNIEIIRLEKLKKQYEKDCRKYLFDIGNISIITN